MICGMERRNKNPKKILAVREENLLSFSVVQPKVKYGTEF